MRWMTPAEMAHECTMSEREIIERIVDGRLRCEGRAGRVMVCASRQGVAPAGLGRLGQLLVVVLLLVAGTGGVIGYRMLSDLRERAQAAEDRGAQLSAQLAAVQAEFRAARTEAVVRTRAAERERQGASRRLDDVEAALAVARRETNTQLAATRDDLTAVRRELDRTRGDLIASLEQLAEVRRQGKRAETYQTRQAEQLTAIEADLKTVRENVASAQVEATARMRVLRTTTTRLDRQVADIRDKGRETSAAIRSLSRQLATLAVRVVKACASQPGPASGQPARKPGDALPAPPPADLAAGSQPSAEHDSPSLFPQGRTVFIHGHPLAQDGARIDTSATALPSH